MKQTGVIAAALAAGFVGGALGTLVTRASEQSRHEISYWGVDKVQNVVLAFGTHGLAEGGPPIDLKDPANETDAIGVFHDETPFLRMRGADGRTRVDMFLSLYGKPFLSMDDETGPRVRLGFEGSDTPNPDDSDYSLVFTPEVARIGFHAEKVGGQTYVQGGVYVRQGKVKYPE